MYTFTTHCRLDSPASKSRPIVGSAMFTTVASSAARPEPRTVASSTQRPAGLPKRRLDSVTDISSGAPVDGPEIFGTDGSARILRFASNVLGGATG